MSDVIISPNMSLPVPIVGQDPGPDWANNINACLGILDQHNHATGQGVQITPAGININADLPINGNNLTTIKTANFVNLPASLPGVTPNLGAVYVAANELYYNDEVGNVVQITNNGTVNAGAGSITGLPSGTASASYNSGSQTFVWQSATSTPANMDFASAIFRNLVANSKGLTLNPPNAMGADYSVQLPTPNGTGNSVFLTYDTSNNITVGPSTVLGITGANIANQTITQGNLAPRTVASTAPAGGVAISNTSGLFTTTSGSQALITNQTITLTTTGRPVRVGLQSDGVNRSELRISAASAGGNLTMFLELVNGVTVISIETVEVQAAGSGGAVIIGVPAASVSCIDTTVAGIPGTYTYTATVSTLGGATAGISNVVLVAYEI